MNPTFRRLGPSELLPRYIFAEALFARRRVLEVGAVASTLGASAEFLVTRGARSVVAMDDDFPAVEEAQKRLGSAVLRFRGTVYEDLPPGSFDVVLIADLGPFVLAPELLARLARLLAAGGHLIGGLRNPAGLALSQLMDPEGADAPPTYGQLLDALSTHFPSVEVATQSPLLGYQLAFERGEGLQVDGSLAGTAEAAYFVVLAGFEPVRQVDPTWVQLPPAPLAFTSGRVDEYAQRTKAWEERSGRLKEALGQVRAELDGKTSEAVGLQSELERARTEWQRVVAQLEHREGSQGETRERDELATRLRRLESELQVARERAEDAERRAEKHRAETADAARLRKEGEAQVLAAQEEKRLERVRKEELAALLEDNRSRLARAYEELREAQDEVNAARVAVERGKLTEERFGDELRGLQQKLEQARDRELGLAEQQSTSLAALEHLQGGLAEARRKLEAHNDELLRRDAEIARLARVAEADQAALREAQEFLAYERAQHATARQETAERLQALGTELAGAQSGTKQLAAEVRRLEASEGHQRSLAAGLEQKLAATREATEEAEQTVGALKLQLDEAAGRIRALEREAVDARAAVGEQLEAQARAAQARVGRLETEGRVHAEAREALQLALQQAEEGHRRQQAALEHALEEERAASEASRQEAARVQSALQERLDTLGAELARAEGAAEAARGEIRALEGTLRDQTARLEQTGEAQGQLEALRAQVEGVQRELHDEAARASGLEAHQVQLESELRASGASLARFEAQAADAETRLSIVQAQLSETTQALEVQTAHAVETSQAQATLEAALSAERATSDSLRAQLHILEASRAGLEAEAAGLQRSLANLDQGNAEALARSQALQAQLASAAEALAGAEARAEAAESAVQASKAEAAARAEVLEAGSRDLERQRDLAQRDLALHREESQQALAAQRDEAQRELHALRAEVDALRAQLAATEERTRGLGGELEGARSASQERDALRGALESAAAARAEAEAALEASQARARNLEAQMEELRRAEEASKRDLSSAQTELKGFTGQLAANRVIREQLQKDLEAERQKSRRLGAATAELEASSEFTRQLLEEKSAQLSLLEERMGSELPELQDEVSRLREDVARAGREREEQVEAATSQAAREAHALREELARAQAATSDVSQLRNELTQLQASRATLEAELSAARTFRHEAEDRTVSTQTALRALQAELPPLKAQLDKLGQEHARALEEARAFKAELAESDADRLGLQALSEGTQAHVEELERDIASLKAELAAQQAGARNAKQREVEVTTKLTEREAKLDVLQRRLAAQEAELVALRRAAGRVPPGANQVKEIFERANAELTAAKADLGKRPAAPAPVPASSGGLPALPPPKPLAGAPRVAPTVPPAKPDKKGGGT